MSATSATSATPSSSLLANLRGELMQMAPFAQMSVRHVERFISASAQAYYAPDEILISPADGALQCLWFLRRGNVTGKPADASGGASFQLDPGDLFPIGAVMAGRAVSTTYRATVDTFCLLLPLPELQALLVESAPFADFLNSRMQRLLALSRSALQATYSAQALAEQSLEARLSSLMRGAPVAVSGETPLRQALLLMQRQNVGSVLVLDSAGAAQGILTRHDLLGRVTLPQVALTTPISQVMSSPVLTLDKDATAHDATLLMSLHGVRHVPVTQAGRVIGMVSERDLFAMQKLSIKRVSAAMHQANTVAALQDAAHDVRQLATRLLGQGMGARQITELISHLNDGLTERLVQLKATEHGVDLQQVCWLAFGSEGRSEQSIATDQDNGLVFSSDDAQRNRPAWLAFARSVNEALDACGYPLCKGNVMASNPACCLTSTEWCARFEHWIEHGAPEDLLNASIYFDLRPLAGNRALARPMREFVTRRAAGVPRFIQQMAHNARRSQTPLDWLGGFDTKTLDGREVIDLKLQGTAIFVDVARLYALANGVAETNTRRRFEAIAVALKAGPQEREAWSNAFEFLQMLRLRVQVRAAQGVGGSPDHANLIEPDTLDDIDRRVLKECFRILRRLQQRMALDYP